MRKLQHSLQIRVLLKKHVIAFVTFSCYNKTTEPERNHHTNYERKNMMKSIGDKIKEYRQKSHMTQEQLAACLNVTFQSVSKWETGVSCPDLSLIVPITKLFHISADELLGINDVEADKRYEELKQAYDHTFQTEDFPERQRICELAVSEYPGDMQWLNELAWVVSNRSFEYEDNETYVAEQEKAIKLFDAVVKNCKDDVMKGNAILGITQLLGWRGRKEEAKKYMEMLPEETMITRESVLENILEGDELILFKQKRIMNHIFHTLRELSLMPAVYTDVMREIVSVMFPDGNYLEFHHTLYYAVKREINHMLKHESGVDNGKLQNLLKELKAYAEAYDKIVFAKPGVYRYTSPWFDHIEEDTREWLGNQGTTLMQDLRAYLEEPQFNGVRDTDFFRSLKK